MFTEKTKNLGLPQWKPTEHPDFLNDMNPAYRAIDAFAGNMTEEYGGLPNQMSLVQARLQSLGEDLNTAQAELAALQIQYQNQQVEVDKITPLQNKVAGLQTLYTQLEAQVQVLENGFNREYELLKTDKEYTFVSNDGNVRINSSNQIRSGITLFYSFAISGAIASYLPIGNNYLYITEEETNEIMEKLKVNSPMIFYSIPTLLVSNNYELHGSYDVVMDSEEKRLGLRVRNWNMVQGSVYNSVGNTASILGNLGVKYNG